MTFEEFKSISPRSRYFKDEESLEYVYNRVGPFAWTTNIYTKELETVNWKQSKIRYYDLTVEEELDRRKYFKSLYDYKHKLELQKQKMQNLKNDF